MRLTDFQRAPFSLLGLILTCCTRLVLTCCARRFLFSSAACVLLSLLARVLKFSLVAPRVLICSTRLVFTCFVLSLFPLSCFSVISGIVFVYSVLFSVEKTMKRVAVSF